jgi:hypothetical protein
VTLRKAIPTFVLFAGLVASAVLLVQHLRAYPFPGNQEGYAPEQPIAFSHKQHAGDLGIGCLYCHHSAAKSPHAGMPAASLCMNCHKFVTTTWEVARKEQEDAQQEGRPKRLIISSELQKLYDAQGLAWAKGKDKEGWEKDPAKAPKPIAWVKVHNVPDYTRFDHRVHVNAKVACQECHGPVQTMDVIRQSVDLSMGWCLRCHKEHKDVGGKKVSPSTDCAACHY